MDEIVLLPVKVSSAYERGQDIFDFPAGNYPFELPNSYQIPISNSCRKPVIFQIPRTGRLNCSGVISEGNSRTVLERLTLGQILASAVRLPCQRLKRIRPISSGMTLLFPSLWINRSPDSGLKPMKGTGPIQFSMTMVVKAMLSHKVKLSTFHVWVQSSSIRWD